MHCSRFFQVMLNFWSGCDKVCLLVERNVVKWLKRQWIVNWQRSFSWLPRIWSRYNNVAALEQWASATSPGLLNSNQSACRLIVIHPGYPHRQESLYFYPLLDLHHQALPVKLLHPAIPPAFPSNPWKKKGAVGFAASHTRVHAWLLCTSCPKLFVDCLSTVYTKRLGVI